MKKIYLVVENSVCDFEELEEDMKVYTDLEQAKTDFEKQIQIATKDMREIIADSNDIIIEKLENDFCIYYKNYYNQYHITIKLIEKNIG